MKNSVQIITDIRHHANPEKAKILQRYFKAGKGEYGDGDIFLGLTVPLQRNIAKKYTHISLQEIKDLLHSTIHEFRQTALMILGLQFQKSLPSAQKNIYDFYLKNIKYINNWDLIDGSAPTVVGGYLLTNLKERKVLSVLVKSKSIWERRIGVMATYTFIQNNSYDDTLRIAKILLNDTHDLIHKAVGWMLREIGKRSLATEETFLRQHYKKMPRTMLRYAIEKFPETKRQAYLRGTI